MPTIPTLPTAEVDVTYSLPGGTTRNVDADHGGNLQTAINAAALGDVIVATAGTDYGNVALPNKGAGTSWIYLISSANASLPASGTRVALADVTNMPTVTTGGTTTPAINCNNGAHHYRFVGFRVRNTTNNCVEPLVDFSPEYGDEAVEANNPHHMILDRCLITNNQTNCLRAVTANGSDQAVIECYIENFAYSGSSQETWCISDWNGRGPILIRNNYLEAAGINVFFGGVGTLITNLSPSDITIIRNEFVKDVAWKNSTRTVKNLIELKHCQRVLIEGNRFHQTWVEEQDGQCMNLSVNNQDNNNPWCMVNDITIRYNKAEDFNQFVSISGEDNYNVSAGCSRVLIEHNLALCNSLTSTGNGGDGSLINPSTPTEPYPQDVTIRHNTFLRAAGTGASIYSQIDSAALEFDDWDITDNIFADPVDSDLNAEGTATLNGDFANTIFDFNAMIGRNSANYPAGNFFPADVAAVAFVNYQTTLDAGNFRLAAGSNFKAGAASDASDGTDLGADIDAIEAAMAGEGGGGSAIALDSGGRRGGRMIGLVPQGYR